MCTGWEQHHEGKSLFKYLEKDFIMLKSCVLLLIPRAFAVARGFIRVAIRAQLQGELWPGGRYPSPGHPKSWGILWDRKENWSG